MPKNKKANSGYNRDEAPVALRVFISTVFAVAFEVTVFPSVYSAPDVFSCFCEKVISNGLSEEFGNGSFIFRRMMANKSIDVP